MQRFPKEVTVAWIKKSIPVNPDSQKLLAAVTKFENAAGAADMAKMATIKKLIESSTNVQIEIAAYLKKKLDPTVMSAAVKLDNSAKLVRNIIAAAEKEAKSADQLASHQKVEIVAIEKKIAIGERKLKEFAAKLKSVSNAIVKAKPEDKPRLRDNLKKDFERAQKESLSNGGQEWETFWRASVSNLGKLSDANAAKVKPLSDRMAMLIKSRDAVRSFAKGVGAVSTG